MKTLLLSVALSLAMTHAYAGDDVIAMSSSTGIGVLRSGGNLYRPSPRGGSISNASRGELIYRPTQHFYLKDSVVSYRYTSDSLAKLGGEYGNAYHGPHAAQFLPGQHPLAPHGRLRTYAAVNQRPQPGVPMVERSTRVRTTTRNSPAPETTIQLAGAK